jgi:hypothetical protein
MAIDPPRQQWRSIVLRYVPFWMQGAEFSKLMYAIGVHLDGLADMATIAVQYAFPGYYAFDTLDPIGRARGIVRGPAETNADYAERLRGWLDAHRLRAGPVGLLTQLREFWDAAVYNIAEVNVGGLRYQVLPDGSLLHDVISWSPIDDASRWAQYWVFLDWPMAATDDGIWDDPGTWDDGGMWDLDSSFTAQDVDDLTRVPRAWNAAHCERGQVVLLDGSHGLWDYPPGLWDEPGDTWESEGPAIVTFTEN